MPAQATIVLEPAAQEVADAFSKPPFLYELEYPAARKILDDAQAASGVEKLAIDDEWVTVPSAYGDARVWLIRPKGADGILPVILYMHGGGWVLGNAATHDRLVRELAVGAEAALAFVEYPNAPEGRYPVAIEQEPSEESGELVVRIEREHVCDVLIGTNDDHRTVRAIDAAQIEDVAAVAQVGRKGLLVVDEPEPALPRKQDGGQRLDVDVAVALLKDRA